MSLARQFQCKYTNGLPWVHYRDAFFPSQFSDSSPSSPTHRSWPWPPFFVLSDHAIILQARSEGEKERGNGTKGKKRVS